MDSRRLTACRICPFECGIDRTDKRGPCGASDKLEISSWNLHHGEESPISGTRGSGTIFLTHCALRCIFCQNYPISHLGNGREFSIEEFTAMILDLQERGAHNINFVTPTHYTPHIIEVLKNIKNRELKIPVVYNTSGYEKVETLRELEGLIDIYMPDAKYSDPGASARLCRAGDYWDVNKAALKEMYRQGGGLKINSDGIAVSGILIRHMVLPGDLSGTPDVLEFIAREISPMTYVSIMSQYHPAYKTAHGSQPDRNITAAEYEDALECARELGMENCFIQGL